LISNYENEHDFLLPDLPLVNTDLDKYAKEYRDAIIAKARSMSKTHAGVDRLLGQKNVEKNRRYQEKKN